MTKISQLQNNKDMLPIGKLMIEHRLIERMTGLMEKEARIINLSHKADLDFIDAAVDFLRVYADHCHHGKEENLFFKALELKDLTVWHKKLLDELLDEHKRARVMVAKLMALRKTYPRDNGKAAEDIAVVMLELVEFYSGHIRKEDKDFFVPSMKYFNKQELSAMMEDFREFDLGLIHEKYTDEVERLSRL
jgi:hemerythrin-like domain-containing protein